MSTKFVATGTQIVASMALGVGAKRPMSAPAGTPMPG